MLSLAGVPAPKEMQGRTLVPLMQGKSKGWRTHFLCEYFMETGNPRIASWEAVRNQRYKLVHYTDLIAMDELYDLQNDPGELKNLISDPAARPVLETLRKQLSQYRKEIPS
jgi:arylsulfatase A-like enzyme